MAKSSWVWGWGVLQGLLQVLVLLLLLEEHRRHLCLQDPGEQKKRCSETAQTHPRAVLNRRSPPAHIGKTGQLSLPTVGKATSTWCLYKMHKG